MKMKHKSIRALIAALIFIFAIATLFSCEKRVTVSFDAQGGTEVHAQQVELGGYATLPETPKREGYAFAGWYSGVDKWDFEHYVVTGDMTLVAKWTETYTVTFETSGGSATADQTLVAGEKPTKPQDPVREGYVFAGWFTTDGYEWTFAEEAPNADMSLTAKWLKRHTVTFDEATAGASYPAQVVTEGDEVAEPTAPVKAGYTFMGWFYGGTPWNFETDTPRGDMKLVAKWAENCTVSFDANGGTTVASANTYVGAMLTAPTAPTKPFHDFAGWYSGDKLWDFTSEAIPGNMTLTAKWVLKSFTVSFDTDGAGTIAAQTVKAHEKATAPTEPVKEGYSFLGWFNGESEWFFTTSTVESDVTLTAKWALNYKVSFDPAGGSAVPTQTVPSGGYAKAPTPPTRENYAFDGWYVDGVKWEFETRKVTANVTLTAKWTQTYFTVSFDTNGGTPSAMESQNVARGELARRPSDPTREGYIFIGWYTEAGEFNFATPITANVPLVAKWLESYKVTFDTDGGNTIPDQNVTKDTVISPVTPTREGYRFLGWYWASEDRMWNVRDDKVKSDMTLKAKWQKTATVTFDNDGTRTTATVDEGATLTKPQDPTREGYAFEGWYNGDIKWNFENNTVTADVTLTAKWRRLYTVSFDTNGAATGVSPITGIESGSKITAPSDVPLKPNYDFDGWYNGDTKWNFESDTVTADVTLTAHWKPKPHKVSYDLNGGTGTAPDANAGYGTTLTKPQDPTRESYTFVGWYYGDRLWNFESDTVAGDMELVAHWSNDDPFDGGVIGPPHDWTSGG